MTPLDDLGATIGAIALSLPRVTAAFLILPLISGQNMPALVRNSFFVSLAIIIYPVAAAVPAHHVSGAIVPLIILKELFIGACFGFLFSSVFWAVSAAGTIIDTNVGSNFAAVVDPIQGHETSLTGQLLTQLAAWLFMASGAFTLFLNMLMTSYTVWPVSSMLPALAPAGQQLFIDEFASVLSVAVMLAAPALIVLSLLDLSLGLVNRYAQQLNVFSLTLSLKSWVATFIVLLSLGTYVEVITRRLFENRGLLQVLKDVL
ncbi:MAG TPA: type III secretion system export apparatus subunit SctT [Steroidobacteraceae bacterium]